MADHFVLHSCTIVFALISQLCSVFMHVAVKDRPLLSDVFSSLSGNNSYNSPLEVSMDRWGEHTWIFIDAWTIAWLTHSVCSIFRRNVLGPVCCNPEIHTPQFYLTWTIINVARIFDYCLVYMSSSWILLVPSFVLLFASYLNLDKHRAWLKINNPGEMWTIRYLTQNGLALFAWWVLLEFVVDIGVMLNYTGTVKDPLASTIVLVIIVSCAVVWFLLHGTLFNRYTQHTFIVYPALFLGLGAMFTRSYNFHDFSSNTIFCGIAMVLMVILSLIQTISLCFYEDKSSRPLGVTIEFCETVCKPEGKSSKP